MLHVPVFATKNYIPYLFLLLVAPAPLGCTVLVHSSAHWTRNALRGTGIYVAEAAPLGTRYTTDCRAALVAVSASHCNGLARTPHIIVTGGSDN